MVDALGPVGERAPCLCAQRVPYPPPDNGRLVKGPLSPAVSPSPRRRLLHRRVLRGGSGALLTAALESLSRCQGDVPVPGCPCAMSRPPSSCRPGLVSLPTLPLSEI